MLFFSSKNRLLVLLIIFFLLANVRIVLASSGGCAAIGLISPSQALKCMLDEFGINEDTVTENAKYLDVANYKQPQPQVTVTFTPTDPTPGEEATASALPTYFGNHLESLYYTWYLQTAACPPDPNLDGDFQKSYPDGSASEIKCNLNSDHETEDRKSYGIVDMEDYKIKAMRIYAGNNFEIDDVDYSEPSDEESAYQAIMGGDDQKDKNNSCYFYDTNLGIEYTFQDCFHLFPDAPGYETGDESFDTGEEYFWRTNPDDPDTAQTGHPDEANVAGLGASDFSWTYQSGDQIGVVVEGVSYDSTIFEDSSYKIMWAIPNNTCGNLEDYLEEPEESEDDYATEISPATWPDCPDGCTFTRTVTKRKTLDKSQSEISSATVTSYELFTKTDTIILPSRRRTAGEGEATGGTGGTVGEGGEGGTATIEIGTTTLPFVYPNDSWDPNCNEVDTASLVSSGFFTQTEVDSDEKYQVALSNNGSCCDSAYIIVDEGNPPDDPDDESTWVDNTAACTFAKDPEISITEETTDINSDPEDSLFTMTEDDLNECLLHENMLTPTEGGGKNEKLEVSLSYSPDNPVNDTSDEGDNADSISVVSVVENPTDSESLDYTWNVYAGDSADSDGEWSDPLLKSQLGKDASGNPVVEQTTGAGIPNLKFKANFGSETPNSTGGTSVPKYLKVKLNVSEKVTGSTADEEGTREGHAEVIIPLSSFNNKLSFFNTSVDASSLALTIKKDATTDVEEEICETAASSDCQVAPDEIIAVKADIVLETGETWDDYDFLWELDDQALSYKYDPSYTNSTFKPGNLIFFPVLAEKSSTLDLSLIATNQTTGAKISLSKSFLVSEPTFEITSTDEDTAKPKLLGYYTDLDGTKQYDYSQTEFVALEDSTIELSVEQLASFPLPSEEDLSLKWYWDGTELSATGRTFSFTAASDFSLSAKGLYKQDNDTKKALNEYWGVSIDEFYERQLSQTIDFTLAGSLDEFEASQKGRGKILASFISSVPAYFVFLFRLVMTAFVLLAAIWILFALFPQTEKND